MLGIELTPVARANELDGGSNGRQLVETLLEGVAHEGSWSYMVAASPQV